MRKPVRIEIQKALDKYHQENEKERFKAACQKVVEQSKGKFPKGSVLWYEREFKPQANGNR